MLNKILLVLAILALGAGSYLAYTNRASFIETRKNVISTNKELKSYVDEKDGKIAQKLAEISTEHATWADAGQSKRDKTIGLNNANSNFTAKTEDLGKLTKDIAEKTAEMEKWQAAIAEAVGPEGLDGITAKVEQLSRDITALKADAEAQQKELEVANKKVAEGEATVASLQKTAAARNRGISLNGTEGTVIATNQDYGFAVVNIGESKGVTADSKLIVKRGDQRIGLLSISSISANRTIADIVGSSLAPGETIAPGDRVILEKVQR